jgi:hypothetical protein
VHAKTRPLAGAVEFDLACILRPGRHMAHTQWYNNE